MKILMCCERTFATQRSRYDPATQKIDWVIDWVMGTGQDRTHMALVSKDLKTVFTSKVSSATISRRTWR
jgi:hypothetical protein